MIGWIDDAKKLGAGLSQTQTFSVEVGPDGVGAWQTTLHPQPNLFLEYLQIEAIARAPEDGAVAAQAFASLNFYRGPLVEPLPDPRILQAELNRRNREELALRCQEHVTWPAHSAQPGDTMESLAARTGATVGQLRRANCLPVLLQPAAGTVLRVPRQPGPAPPSPALLVDAPLTNGVPIPNAYFPVSGTLTGAITGTLFVRVLDTLGRLLAERTAQVAWTDSVSDPSAWRTELLVPDVPSGTRALVYACLLSPDTHAILAADGVPVILGTNEPDAILPSTRHFLTPN